MVIASKYIESNNKLLFIFPDTTGETFDDPVIQHIRMAGQQWIQIGDTWFIPLDDELVESLKATDRFILATSGPEDFKVSIITELEVPQITVGQILTYYELGKEITEKEKEDLEESARLFTSAWFSGEEEETAIMPVEDIVLEEPVQVKVIEKVIEKEPTEEEKIRAMFGKTRKTDQ